MKLASGLLAATVCAMVASAGGCGTLIYGFHEKVPVASVPAGASVTVDGEPEGYTPVTVELRRGKQHKIRIEEAGYVPYESTTLSGPTSAVLLDVPAMIVFPPALLLGIGDYETGAMSNIVPGKIDAHLLRAPNASSAAPSSAAKPAAPAPTRSTAPAEPATTPNAAPSASPTAAASPAATISVTAATAAAAASITPSATPAAAFTPASRD